MIVSCNWLKEYTDQPFSPEELARRLSGRGVVVEVVRHLQQGVRGVLIGELLQVERHPNSEHLWVCQTNVGQAAPLTIVTGAQNVGQGDKVPVAVPGAVIADGRELGIANFRGIESHGMLCSPEELGIDEGGDGILILPPDAPVGADAVPYLGLDDTVLELDLTANYGVHCQAMVGVAQELAAITGGKVNWPIPWRHGDEVPELRLPNGDGVVTAERAAPKVVEQMLSVRIDAPDLCQRYTATIIEGVRIGPSPGWLQARIRAAGMRPINNVVDVTNFVMLELGQPLHAFDYHKVKGAQIIVRRAADGERLTTLDKQDRQLDSSMLVIADTEEPVGLAGVMGGYHSEITAETSTILLESAVFEGINNRATARKLGLFSAAQSRYTKGVDPNGALAAAKRAADLMVELGGGRILPGVIDEYPRPRAPRLLPLRLRRVREFLGVKLPRTQVEQHLDSFGIAVERQLSGFLEAPQAAAPALMARVSPWPARDSAAYANWAHHARIEAERAAIVLQEYLDQESEGVVLACVPTRRLDIDIEVDLIEEVARAHGYDEIPATLPRGPAVRGGRSAEAELVLAARQALAGMGLAEVMNYSLVHPKAYDRLGLPADSANRQVITIANPLYEERSTLRTSLLPGLLDDLQHNLNRQTRDLQIFEVGRTYHPVPAEILPQEPTRLGIAALGNTVGKGWNEAPREADFFWLKGVVATLLDELNVFNWSVAAGDHPALHPGRRATLLVDGKPAGFFGELHPRVAAAWDLSGRPLVAEIEVAALAAAAAPKRSFHPVPRFPAAVRDVALVIDQAVPVEQVLAAIRRGGGDLVEEVHLFDRYTGDPVAAGRHSLAYSITYRSAERTLTDSEVEAAHAGVRAALAGLGAELRS